MTATSPPLSQRRDVAVLIPAAGLGVRLGVGRPKALHELGGRSLLWHCWRNVAAAPSVGAIVIAAPPGAVDEVRAVLSEAVVGGLAAPGAVDEVRAVLSEAVAGELAAPSAVGEVAKVIPEVLVVEGGATRQESVAAALAAVPPEFDIILVHDAARALTPPHLVEAVADAVRSGHDAVIPGLPVVDTIKQVAADGRVTATVDRSRLRAVQTPQGFRRSVLAKAHRLGGDHTDDAGMVERLGVPVHVVQGHPHALKITTPWDLVIAESVLRSLG
ncbi:MAG TPA: IspD/TarI family cytidylyltransferase [Candidatus Limnocylindrales bacterium]